MYGFSVKVFALIIMMKNLSYLHTSCCSQNDTYKEEIEMYRRLCGEHMNSLIRKCMT